MNLANIVHERLLTISDAFEDIACGHIVERLLGLFYRMAEVHGVPTPGGRYVGVRLTHRDIALLVGSTRETISATMSQLSRAGAVWIDNHQIVVADRISRDQIRTASDA